MRATASGYPIGPGSRCLIRRTLKGFSPERRRAWEARPLRCSKGAPEEEVLQ
jgi:hypothetical protein